MLQGCSPAGRDLVALNVAVPLFALDGSHEHLPAYIQTASTEQVRLRTRSALHAKRRLVMQYEGHRTEIEVVICRKEEAGTYLIDCQIKSSHKGTVRDEWRMEVNWPARVELSDSKTRQKARVRDVSLFGLGIELNFQPELGTLLKVHMRSGVGLGQVKHCRKTGHNRYWAGLYLEEFCSNEQSLPNSDRDVRSLLSLRRLWRQIVCSLYRDGAPQTEKSKFDGA